MTRWRVELMIFKWRPCVPDSTANSYFASVDQGKCLSFRHFFGTLARSSSTLFHAPLCVMEHEGKSCQTSIRFAFFFSLSRSSFTTTQYYVHTSFIWIRVPWSSTIRKSRVRSRFLLRITSETRKLPWRLTNSMSAHALVYLHSHPTRLFLQKICL